MRERPYAPIVREGEGLVNRSEYFYNEHMKTYQFSIVITQDEDGMLLGQVPTLPGCHTQAKTLPVLYKRMREAIELYLEVQKMKKQDPYQEKFLALHQMEVAL